EVETKNGVFFSQFHNVVTERAYISAHVIEQRVVIVFLVVFNAARGDFIFEAFVSIELFQRKIKRQAGFLLNAARVDKYVFAHLPVNVLVLPHFFLSAAFQVSVAKVVVTLASIWNKEKSAQKYNHRNNRSANKIRTQKPRKRNPGTQNGNNLCIIREFGRKPDHRKKQENWEQQVCKINRE